MPMVMYGAMQTLPLRLAASPAVSQMLNCVHPMQPSQTVETTSNRFITKILDHNGNVLIENTAAERSVIKESTAFLLTSAMEDVVKQGTGTACQLDNMPVAGKQVQQRPITTCGLWAIHRIIHAQYGPVMTTTKNYRIMRVTSTKLSGKRL